MPSRVAMTHEPAICLSCCERNRADGFGYAFQSLFRHGENAQFVDGAETVFESADQAETGMRVAFEIQDGIDDMFQYARACQCAFLGDMPYHDDGGA